MRPRAGIDIGYILQRIKKNWLSILSSVIVAMLLAIIAIYILPKKYKVTASLKVNDESSNAIVENLFEGVKLVEENKNTSNEIAILKSFKLVKKVITKLKFCVSYFEQSAIVRQELFNEVPFSVELDTNANQIISSAVGVRFLDNQNYILSISDNVQVFNYKNGGSLLPGFHEVNIEDTVRVGHIYENEYLRFKLIANSPIDGKDKFYFQLENPALLAEEYRKNLIITPIAKDASILEINLISNVPEKEIKFINHLIQLYVEETAINKNQIAQRTIDFIDQQLSTISDSLKNAELGLQEFRSNNRVLDFNYESKNVYDELKSLEKQKSDEQIKFKNYEYLSEYVKGDVNDLNKIIAPSVMGIQDPALNELITTLSSYTAQKTALNYSAKEKNPKFNKLDENIEQTRAAIIENVNNIKIASQIRLKNIQLRLNKVEQEIDALPETERILLSAQRKFDFSDNIYKYFLEKQGEAAILRQSYTPSDVIIDSARVEGAEPVAPNKKLIFLVLTMAGFIIPIGLIFTRDIIASRILVKEDIYNDVSAPASIIEEIPKSNKHKAWHKQFSIDIYCFEAFRSLRFKIENKANSKIIGVTSLVKGDGKSFCTINIAKAFGFSGKKILVMDLNVANPTTTRELLVGEPKEVQTVLPEEVSAVRILQTTFPNIYCLVQDFEKGKSIDEVISNGMLTRLFDKLIVHFDYIFIDCPAILTSANFLMVSNLTQMNIFVVRKNHTPSDLTKLHNLVSTDISRYHFVFNFSES